MNATELIDLLARMEPTDDAEDAITTLNRLIHYGKAIQARSVESSEASTATAKPAAPWLTEFGPEYEVDAAITSQLKDDSDGQWSCPTFISHHNDAPELVRLWVEHPDPTKRESDTVKRYNVTVEDREGYTDIILETDDLGEALHTFAEKHCEING
jgi:hypothetical protein